jgi:hypothetical protein
MVELTDELIDIIESHLEDNGIELSVQELDEIRDTLDAVLDEHKE